MENSLKDTLGSSLSSSLQKAKDNGRQHDGQSQIASKRQSAISTWFETQTSGSISDNPFVLGFIGFDDEEALW